MNNDNVEKKLLEASKQADKFFSSFDYNKLNNTVLLKLKHENNKENRIKMLGGFTVKVSVIAVCFILILVISSSLGIKKTIQNNNDFALLGKPVSQQMIDFGNTKLNQWLNYFKIDKPDKKMESNLLAVVWESGTKGDYDMVYSSVFENSNKPCPVYNLDFPGNYPSMVLISSQNDRSQYMHYRILGYKGNKLSAYVEKDYVTGCKIEVIDGVLKETRLIPSSYSEEIKDTDQMNNVVTYYIPYQHSESGNIISSVNFLRIFKGDKIALFGDYDVPIDIAGNNLLIQEDTNEENSIKYLHAEKSGYQNIYIKSKDGKVIKKVSIEVLSNDDINEY